MSSRFFGAALAAALLSTSIGAASAADASLMLSGIQITVVDLGSGTTPSVWLTGRSSADAFIGGGGAGQEWHLNSTTFAAPVWATLPPTPTASASAWMLGDPYGPGANAQVDASHAAAPSGLSQASVWFADPAFLDADGFNFVLSPYSELLITATVDAYAYADQPGASATAGVFFTFDADTPQGDAHEAASWTVSTDGLPPGGRDELHEDIVFAIVNPYATALEGTLDGLVSAVAASTVAEPGGAAMLLAAAVLLLCRGRRAAGRP